MLASDYRAKARESLNSKWGMAILVCVIGWLFGGIAGRSPLKLNFQSDGSVRFGIGDRLSYDLQLPSIFYDAIVAVAAIAVFYALFSFIMGAAIELGICRFFVRTARKEQAGLKDEFAYFSRFVKALGLRIVMTVFITLWSFLFIIPGIIAAYRYAMAAYIMAEHPEMGIMDAIASSKEMMMGQKWNLFCLDFSFIGWAVLSALTCGIGLIFLTPYTQTARAHFYLQNKGGQ